jgi:hypothetical protein
MLVIQALPACGRCPASGRVFLNSGWRNADKKAFHSFAYSAAELPPKGVVASRTRVKNASVWIVGKDGPG